jgi:hypothetical protein
MMGMAEADTTTGSGADRAAYWRELNRAWATSGQTQAAFCQQRQVNPGTFAWWRRALARRDGGGSRPRPVRRSGPAFVEVTGRREPVGGYELVLANGRRIVIRGGFEDGSLRRLISVAEAGC